MKDRIITKDEINKVTNECKPREKAFFTIMRQSGLEPHIIKKLKIKNVEKILELNPPTPCKVEVSKFGKPPAFVGEEAIKYLKQYLEARALRSLTPESLLFTIHGDPKKEINTKDVSRAFRTAAEKLNETGKISFEVRRGKPSELRLYSLIEFYKENAKDYLKELKSSTSKDDEVCRKLYEEKAMPLLETETLTPEIYKLKKQLKKIEQDLKITRQWYHSYMNATKEIEQEMKQEIEKRNCQLKELHQTLKKYEPLLDLISDMPTLQILLDDIKEGKLTKIETERTVVTQYPMEIVNELMKQAEKEGKNYLEINYDKIKKTKENKKPNTNPNQS